MSFMDMLIGESAILLEPKSNSKRKNTKQMNNLDFLLECEPDISSENMISDWMDYEAVVDHFCAVVDPRSAVLYAQELLLHGDYFWFESNVYDFCRVKRDVTQSVYFDHYHGFWKMEKATH